MSDIIVAGGGNGGITAAIHLAKAGHSVTLFEKRRKDSLGMHQTDALDIDTFSYAGLPNPNHIKRGVNIITFHPQDKTLQPLTLPGVHQGSFLADRVELAEYLFDLAEKAGVKICYEEGVLSPVVYGNRVCGVVTEKGTYHADLVIDACGVHSPVRENLPASMGINRAINKYDIIYSYRGYFNRVPDTDEPATDYNIYFNDDGNKGFSWLITEFDRVDALICRFYKPDTGEISSVLNKTHQENPHMGLDLVYGGEHSIIPVCHPLGVLVADGYAAIGDSAFMTVALKGSGITYSIKAGKMLADCVLSDANCHFDCEALWEYQKRFFKEIGFTACSIAIMKNILPFLTAEDVNDLFRSQIITTDELSVLWQNTTEAIFSTKALASAKDKIRLVRDNQKLREILTSLVVRLGKFAILQASLPVKYNKNEVYEWEEKYNSFFDSIRRKD